MKFTLSEKHIVIVFCLLFAMSSAFLFWQNERALDPNQGKSWWILSFTEPATRTSLGFTIENHSQETRFQYQIVSEKKILLEDTINLTTGEKRTITPDVTPSETSRTSIVVTSGTEKQEIYR